MKGKSKLHVLYIGILAQYILNSATFYLSIPANFLLFNNFLEFWMKLSESLWNRKMLDLYSVGSGIWPPIFLKSSIENPLLHSYNKGFSKL